MSHHANFYALHLAGVYLFQQHKEFYKRLPVGVKVLINGAFLIGLDDTYQHTRQLNDATYQSPVHEYYEWMVSVQRQKEPWLVMTKVFENLNFSFLVGHYQGLATGLSYTVLKYDSARLSLSPILNWQWGQSSEIEPRSIIFSSQFELEVLKYISFIIGLGYRVNIQNTNNSMVKQIGIILF
mgnify:CR=1 FL=1